MKTSNVRKILFFSISLSVSLMTNAQVATWTFNNVLTGTGSANSVAGSASLGSTIAAGGAFNGGTVYYGEGNWPSGSIDMNAYLEFSITPTASHTITISTLSMEIRRSTTGTSGAGPNTWSLRSSLDGYATDISSGVLTANSSPATVVTLGIGFINLSSKITFRLYGYNATVSSGGLNRFVYDNIIANGSTVLPVSFEDFKVVNVNQNASLSWKLSGEGNTKSVTIERSEGGDGFETVKTFNGDQINAETTFEYIDQLNHPSGMYAYRIQLISADGHWTYSSVQTVSFDVVDPFRIQPIQAGNTVSFRVYTEKAGNYTFSLFNFSGNKVAGKTTQLSAGNETIQMENRPLKSGIYILLGESGSQKISTKIMVL